MRHQAYESVALQQALLRIEALEARLAHLERRPAPSTDWMRHSIALAS
jgi:hypothetical protein